MINIQTYMRYADHRKRKIVFYWSSIIIYLIIFGLIINNLESHKITLEAYILKFVLIELQMLLSVYLLLQKSKKGYISALLLNAGGFLLASTITLLQKNIYFIPDIIAYLGVMIIVNILYNYHTSIIEQVEIIENQKNNITESEERYQKEIVLLLNQNKIMREKEKSLNKIIYFDDLTNVLNRKMFIEELNIQVEFLKGKDKKLYVVYIDIDNFKKINDTMGHGTGNFVLKELTKRIKDQMDEEDIIGRLGGDEIGMLIIRKLDRIELSNYINRIREEIMKPYVINKHKFRVTASFGIAIYPEDGMDSDELLNMADTAMYCSKNRGKNQIYFSGN